MLQLVLAVLGVCGIVGATSSISNYRAMRKAYKAASQIRSTFTQNTIASNGGKIGDVRAVYVATFEALRELRGASSAAPAANRLAEIAPLFEDLHAMRYNPVVSDLVTKQDHVDVYAWASRFASDDTCGTRAVYLRQAIVNMCEVLDGPNPYPLFPDAALRFVFCGAVMKFDDIVFFLDDTHSLKFSAVHEVYKPAATRSGYYMVMGINCAWIALSVYNIYNYLRPRKTKVRTESRTLPFVDVKRYIAPATILVACLLALGSLAAVFHRSVWMATSCALSVFFLVWRFSVELGIMVPLYHIQAAYYRAVKVDATSAAIGKWKAMVSNPLSILNAVGAGDPILIEVKSVLHMLYYLHCGKKSEAASWLTNLVFTRPMFVANLLGIVNQPAVDSPLSYTIEHNSSERELTPDQYTTYMALLESDGDVDAYLASIITMESLGLETLLPTIHAAFVANGLDHMSLSDINKANVHHKFLDNVRRDGNAKIDAIYKMISVVGRLVFSCDPFDLKYQAFNAEIMEVVKFSDKLAVDYSFARDRELQMSAIRVYKKGRSLLVDERLANHPSYMVNMLRDATKSLYAKAREASFIIYGSTSRAEPTCVIFTGPPGVGKSASIKELQNAIVFLNGDPDKSIYDESMTYYYKTNEDYWENYRQNMFVVMDDLFKEADGDLRLKQACDIISMINTTPMPLNMAFEEKGKVNFDSDFVLCTTNVANDGLGGAINVKLTDPGALLRRFHIELHSNTPLVGDVADKLFTVRKCLIMPHLVGRDISVRDLGYMLVEYRARQTRLNDGYRTTPVKLAAMYPKGQANPFEEPIVAADGGRGVEMEAGELKDLDPVEYFKFMTAKLYATPAFSDPKTYALIAAFFFVAIAVSKYTTVYSWFFDSKVDVESDDSRNDKRGRRSNRTIARNLHTTSSGGYFNVTRTYNPNSKPGVDAESRAEACKEACNGRLSRGIVSLVGHGVKDGRPISESAVGFHLRDGFICTPSHFFIRFIGTEGATLDVAYQNHEYRIPMPGYVQQLDTEDLVLFNIGRKVDLPVALYDRINPDAASADYAPGTQFLLVTHVAGQRNPKVSSVVKTRFASNITYADYDIPLPITYLAQTSKGDSGSILVVPGDSGQPMIIGMHVGSMDHGDKIGISVPLNQPTLDSLIAYMAGEFTPFPHVINESLPSEMAHVPPARSLIRKSLLHGCMGPTSDAPAALAPFVNSTGVLINPLYKAIAKMHQTETVIADFDEELIADAFLSYYPPVPSRVLTPEQALNGDLVTEVVDSVNMSTSGGWPFSLNRTKGKYAYINVVPGGLEFTDEFRAYLDECITDLESGKQIEVVFADIVKDEIRSAEKVLDGRSRVVSCGPLHYLILCRMFFLPFMKYVQSKCVSGPISVGINPTSNQWAALFHRLMSKAKSVCAGDFQNFDGLLPRALGRFLVRIINRWYNDGQQNARIRELLFDHMGNAWHIVFCYLYQVVDGNPSGQGVTTFYNSWILLIMILIVLMCDYQLTPEEFELAIYGDDHIITTILEGLKVSHLAPHFKRRFGMTLTHFSKLAVDPDDTLLTVRFLGRSFVPEGFYVRAPLELDTVRQIPYWFKSNTDEGIIVASAADSFFREMSQFPKDVFQEYVSTYFAALESSYPEHVPNVRAMLLPYDAYRVSMYGTEQPPAWCSEGLIKYAVDPIMNGPKLAPNRDHKAYDHTLPKSRDAIIAGQSRFGHSEGNVVGTTDVVCESKSLVPEDPKTRLMHLVQNVTHSGDVRDNIVYNTTRCGECFECELVLHIMTIQRFKSKGSHASKQSAEYCAASSAIMHMYSQWDAYSFYARLDRFAVSMESSSTSVYYMAVLEDSASNTDPVQRQHHHEVCMESMSDHAIDGMSGPDATAGRDNVMISTRNEQFSNRATNVLNDTQAAQLGSFQDASEVKVTYTNPTLIQDPYEDGELNFEKFNSDRSMERKYVLETVTWTTDNPANTELTSVSLPGDLLAVPYLASKVKDFYYMRAAIEIDVRVQASTFHYGMIMADYSPNLNDNGFSAYRTNVYNASGYPHILVHAENSGTGTLRIPFINNQRAIPTPEPTDTHMGDVSILVANALHNITGEPDSCTVVVSASFVAVTMFLPYDSEALSARAERRAISRVERISRLTRGAFAGAVTVPRPRLNVRTESKSEARLKAAARSVSTTLERDDYSTTSVRAPKFVRQYASLLGDVADVARAGMTAAAIVGLDKPTTLETAQRVIVSSVPNWGQGKGVSNANKLSLDPEAALSVAPVVAGSDVDEMTIKHIAGTPQLTSIFALVEGTPDTLVCPMNNSPFQAHYTYVDFLASQFRFVSGSYKVKVYITASLMHSVRLAFYLSNGVADWQNCYNVVSHITGATEVEFTLPYCSNSFISDRYYTGDPTEAWGLYVHVISFSTPYPEVSAPIYLNVYKAGASDFRVGCHIQNTYALLPAANGELAKTSPGVYHPPVTTESNPREDFARDFAPLHPSMSGYDPGDTSYVEKIETIATCLHRQMPYYYQAANSWYDTYMRTPAFGTLYMNKELFGLMFMYYRGSTRVQMMRNATTPNVVCARFINPAELVIGDFIQGLDMSNSLKFVQEIEVPWYSEFLFESTTVASRTVRGTGYSASTQSIYCSSCGDDFRFHFLRPVPPGTLSRPIDSVGYAAVVSRYNT